MHNSYTATGQPLPDWPFLRHIRAYSFQPTLCAKSALFASCSCPSISNFHPSTLPREKRPPGLSETALGSYFNPRSRVRSDSCSGAVPASNSAFQSTLPREERQGFYFPLKLLLNFNPRSRVRSDFELLRGSKYPRFQSTLPREERLFPVYLIVFAV